MTVATPAHYRVRNWSNFQHYKDRAPAWIKLHFELLASEDWVSLADASRLLAVVCMLIASRNDGLVPNKPAYVKRVAYLDQEPDFGPLIQCGFLEIPLADASTPQADARPEKRREEKRREEKKEGAAKAPTTFAFVGKIIKLKADALERWRKAYHAIPDIIAELTKADDYYAENPPAGGKWFYPVSKWLERAHEDALAKARRPADDPYQHYAGAL